jgi:hypothetical protein
VGWPASPPPRGPWGAAALPRPPRAPNAPGGWGGGGGGNRNGCRELGGISETQRRVFSKRTVQIEAHLAATGEQPGDPKTRMQADEAASLATRRRKNPEWTPAALAGRWHQEAGSVDLPVGAALTSLVSASAGGGERPPSSLKGLFARLVDPESGLCAHDARFGEAQVIERWQPWAPACGTRRRSRPSPDGSSPPTW